MKVISLRVQCRNTVPETATSYLPYARDSMAISQQKSHASSALPPRPRPYASSVLASRISCAMASPCGQAFSAWE